MVTRSTHARPRLLSRAGLLWGTLLAATAASAANWPSWRGPDHTGISTETNAPVKWSRTENVRWRTALKAAGNSSPIVWGETVYLTENLQNRRRLLAYDRRNGRARWNTAVEATVVSPTTRQNPPCSASPVTDGIRVIAWFGTEGLHAWDMEGTRLWSLDLGPQRHQWGYGSSPVLSGGQVYLNFGPGAEEFIIAVDAATGRELWRTRGPEPPAEDTYGTWSTPLLVQVGGRTQLLVALRDYFAGLDPDTGEEVWRCDGMGMQAKASPVFGEGIASVSGDLRGAEIGVRLLPGLKGNLTDTHRLWRESPPRPRIATGIVRAGRVYGARVNGVLDCVSLDTGEVVWEERNRGAGGNSPIWASPILVGDLLYVVNQAGDTMIVEASPTYRLVEVNRIGETCNATPAVAYGDLFLRTHATLWCIRQPVPPPPSPSQSLSQTPADPASSTAKP